MSRKKVCLFVVTEDWYFLSHRMKLATDALKRGYDVYVITHCTNKKKIIEAFGIKVINWKLKRKSFNLITEFNTIRHLYYEIKRLKPQILFSVALKPIIYSLLLKIFLKETKIINYFGGLGYIFTSNKLSVYFLKYVISSLLRILFMQKNAIVIVQNKDDFNYFKNKIVNKKKLNLIPGSGVDIRFFEIKKRSKNNNIILLPARMLWSKGIREFVECAKLVEKKNPKLKFILAGYPDYENPDAVSINYLKSLKLQKNVEWIGNSDDIISLYKKTLIVLFPSYREGMPKTLLEASSCGIPIISFNVVGCRQIVKDGYNGILVPFGNINLLAKNILKLCDNKELYSTLSINGRELVSKNYSSDIINKKILELWE